MSIRDVEDIKKGIKYIRNVESGVVIFLGINEISSVNERGTAYDIVRSATSKYLKELSEGRKKLEDELKKMEGII